jgi:hypothetical protein
VRGIYPERNRRKYTYYHPFGYLSTVYGLYENYKSIIERGEVVVFEGAKSVMLADSWGIHNTVAILTSHLNPHQLKLLAKLGCRAVFALDKDVSVRDDENIRKLKRFVSVEYVWDKDNLLEPKDSPVDKGFDVWNAFYERRLRY